MKRLLALILSLLICVSFLVSCNKEKGEIEEGETDSNEYIEAIHESKIEDAYLHYRARQLTRNIDMNSSVEDFDNWFFEGYDEFDDFMKASVEDKYGQITKETFEEFSALVICNREEPNLKETRYGDLTLKNSEANKYTITMEKVFVGQTHNAIAPPRALDIILIPKENIPTEPSGLVDIENYEYSYSYHSNYELVEK